MNEKEKTFPNTKKDLIQETSADFSRTDSLFIAR